MSTTPMVSLSDLPFEQPQDQPQIGWDSYADPTEFPPPIPEGLYAFKTTEVKIEKFEAQTGVVSFIMTHTAFDKQTGAEVGTIAFDRISTKVFQRQGIPVSMAADQLRACGITDRPTSPRQWGEAIMSIKTWCEQGNTWDGQVQWDGYCGHKDTPQAPVLGPDNKTPLPQQTPPHALPYSCKGMKSWPAEASSNGAVAQHQAVKPCPSCGSDVAARAKISRRIPRSG